MHQQIQDRIKRLFQGLPGDTGEYTGKHTGKNTENKTVAVIRAEQYETLAAAAQAMKENLAGFKLFGDRDAILNIADTYALDISKATIVDSRDDEHACSGAMAAVKSGEAQAVMKGIIHTSLFAKALLDKRLELIRPKRLLSHVCLMELPAYHKPILLTDSAVNISPDVEKKIQIIRNAVEAASGIGINSPKIACITPVETVNPKIESTLHAAELVKIQNEKHLFGNSILEGPIALDVALSSEAAEMKGIRSRAAGDFDILLLPNLDAANAVYKALSLFGGGVYGGIVMGMRVPVILTSRSDKHESRLISIRFALAAEEVQVK